MVNNLKNHLFESFYDENRISNDFSCPRTPKQNGIMKRKNKTLIDIARTTFCENNLPKYF